MMARVVTVRAVAKINLGLRVKGRRPDGYHELRTVFQAIDLADTLSFRSIAGPFRLRCSGEEAPADERNLVWQAAERLWASLGRAGAPSGVSATMRKRIPPQAGLGGGSADAAAALAALARIWRVRPTEIDLAGLAAELGADVPYFLCGGTALGLGRGDEIYPMADLPPIPVVVAIPRLGIATAEAFKWFDDDVEAGMAEPAPTAGGTARRCAGVWRPDAERLVNDLEACVIRRQPAVGKMIARLRESGASAAAMSGSGSAVFGLFSDSRRASRAAKELAGREWTVLATRTLTRRESGARLFRERPVV